MRRPMSEECPARDLTSKSLSKRMDLLTAAAPGKRREKKEEKEKRGRERLVIKRQPSDGESHVMLTVVFCLSGINKQAAPWQVCAANLAIARLQGLQINLPNL